MYMYEGVGMLKTVIHSMVHHREAPRNHHNTQNIIISQSLAMVHHAIYDPFEHTHAFIHIHTGLGYSLGNMYLLFCIH